GSTCFTCWRTRRVKSSVSMRVGRLTGLAFADRSASRAASRTLRCRSLSSTLTGILTSRPRTALANSAFSCCLNPLVSGTTRTETLPPDLAAPGPAMTSLLSFLHSLHGLHRKRVRLRLFALLLAGAISRLGLLRLLVLVAVHGNEDVNQPVQQVNLVGRLIGPNVPAAILRATL